MKLLKFFGFCIALFALTVSCDNKKSENSEAPVEIAGTTKNVNLEMNDALQQLLLDIDKQHIAGKIELYYNDSLGQKVIIPNEKSVFLFYGQREVIQVPYMKYPGEFKDSVIVNAFNPENFLIQIEGEFAENTCKKVSTFEALYKLIIDGNDQGFVTGFRINADDVEKLKLVDFINEKAVFEY